MTSFVCFAGSFAKISFFILFLTETLFGQVATDRLAPPDRSHPLKTLKIFYESMQSYRENVQTNKKLAEKAILKAIQCLELETTTFLLKTERGKEAAILLKETLDRVLVTPELYHQIPVTTYEPTSWTIPSTEIHIKKSEKGPNSGSFLIANETISRVHEFYEKVKDLPYVTSGLSGANYKEPWLSKNIPDWAKEKVLFMLVWQWFGLALAILLGFLLRRITIYLIGHLQWFAGKSKNNFDDKVIAAIREPGGLIAGCIVWFVSLYALALDGIVFTILSSVVQLVFSIALIRMGYRLSEAITDILKSLARKTAFPLDDALAPIIERSLKAFIVIFGTLVAIQNLGINVMSLMAGLGLGGLAFALAAKDTAANLFGSLMILIDRPFKVGDWIIMAGVEGTVREVGLRSTRIETFYNSVISVPNATVASTSIDNMGKRRYRRIKTTLGLTYDTTPQQIEAFLEGVKRIIQANPFTRKDYFHVCFSGYGASSLDILLYLFLEVPDWSEELIQRQNIYLEILRLAKSLDVSFAFPSSSVYLESTPDQPLRQKSEDGEKLKEIATHYSANGPKSHPTGLGIFTPAHRDL